MIGGLNVIGAAVHEATRRGVERCRREWAARAPGEVAP